MRDICITGLPGAGKGTLATNLQALAVVGGIEAVVIVTGDIARQISKESRETGAFAPEDKMREIINEQVNTAREVGAVVIMEGFPRTLPQLVLAEQMLERPLHVIMETPVMTCIRRLIGRGRQDDTADSIGNRISEHQRIVGEVMTTIQGGDLWEDYLVVQNNDEVHCRQIGVSAEW
jgi:adenylate kinase family enzyme